jgi:hypothetical protein
MRAVAGSPSCPGSSRDSTGYGWRCRAVRAGRRAARPARGPRCTHTIRPGRTVLRWFPAATATALGRLLFLPAARVADLDRAVVGEPAVLVLVVHDLAPLPEPSGQRVWLSLALGIRVTRAGPAACLVRQVVLVVAACGRAPAGRAGARGVPDLGQVPEQGPGIVALGLVPVIAVAGGDGFQGDGQVRLPRDAQPPGAVSAGRAGPARASEGEPRPAGAGGRVMAAGRAGCAAPGRGPGSGPGAAPWPMASRRRR